MKRNYEAEVMACALLLDGEGMRTDLFIQCLPEGAKHGIPRLLLKGYLDGRNGIIKRGEKNYNEETIDADDSIMFLVQLLEYLKKQEDVEQDPDFLLCCKLFFTACKRLAGADED